MVLLLPKGVVWLFFRSKKFKDWVLAYPQRVLFLLGRNKAIDLDKALLGGVGTFFVFVSSLWCRFLTRPINVGLKETRERMNGAVFTLCDFFLLRTELQVIEWRFCNYPNPIMKYTFDNGKSHKIPLKTNEKVLFKPFKTPHMVFPSFSKNHPRNRAAKVDVEPNATSLIIKALKEPLRDRKQLGLRRLRSAQGFRA